MVFAPSDTEIAVESNFELLTVEAAGCPGKTNHCPFKRGSEPRIRIGFKPTRDVRELETSVRAKLGAVFVPFNLEEKNACIGGNLTCPLKAGQTYYYSQSVKILHEYPKVENHDNHDKETLKNAHLRLINKKPFKFQMIKFMTQRFIQVDVQVNWLLNDKSNDASENDVNKREVCIIFLAKVID
uniref:MD-2-related lipid-recognition domain-containing protein n=1 Tax=Ascaris lumbricoides TaxID=6252 RepID=A0A9J2P524_ASCLU